jgi:hypothetical protein
MLPVIMVTALDLAWNAKGIEAAGMIFSPPINQGELLARVSRFPRIKNCTTVQSQPLSCLTGTGIWNFVFRAVEQLERLGRLKRFFHPNWSS